MEKGQNHSSEARAYVEEIKYQTRMLNNLKSWLRNLMILSSLALVLILFGDEIGEFGVYAGIAIMVLSLGGCIAVGLAIRNGRENIGKLLRCIEK